MKPVHCLAACCLAAVPAIAAAQSGDVSAERGLYVSIIGGCHDCHTGGYNESGGKIDPATALAGVPLGYSGPWGTSYASNLRDSVKDMSEEEFVKFAKTFTAKPPMPVYNVHAMEESDLRSLYLYIKSLGEPGAPMPEALPPGAEPATPYIVMEPVMPKG